MQSALVLELEDDRDGRGVAIGGKNDRIAGDDLLGSAATARLVKNDIAVGLHGKLNAPAISNHVSRRVVGIVAHLDPKRIGIDHKGFDSICVSIGLRLGLIVKLDQVGGRIEKLLASREHHTAPTGQDESEHEMDVPPSVAARG